VTLSYIPRNFVTRRHSLAPGHTDKDAASAPSPNCQKDGILAMVGWRTDRRALNLCSTMAGACKAAFIIIVMRLGRCVRSRQVKSVGLRACVILEWKGLCISMPFKGAVLYQRCM